MKSSLLPLVILAAALLSHPSAATPAIEGVPAPPRPEDAAEAAAAAPELSPVIINDPLYRLEIRLPAPYWDCSGPEKLAGQAPPGCAAPQPTPDLLFVLGHKDAPGGGRCELGDQGFLMRNKDDLESFVNGFTDAVASRVGEMQELESSYTQTENPIVHRLAFTASPGAGGGCRMPSAGTAAGPKMRYVFLHYFVRPKGADAIAFKLLCAAPVDVFNELEPEFEFIISSLRYTGELDEQFFVPDAPEDKVLSPKDAARSAGAGGKSLGWMLPFGLILVVWLMMRRRKQPSPT